MSWSQRVIKLEPRTAGCYLITDEIVSKLPELRDYKIGMVNLFIQHTSAGLTLNENWDPDVREDMASSLSRIVPEGNMYIHSAEGPDDMPAHVKSSLVGASVDIPIRNGKLATGTWQGVYLCEFRRARHARNVVATIQGQQ